MAFRQFQGSAGQSWSDPSNWTQGGLPSDGDDVVVYADATVAPGSYDYADLVTYAGVLFTLDPAATVRAHHTYLLDSTLAGGTLITASLDLVGTAGVDGTTLVGTTVSTGFTTADLGLSGIVSVGAQAGPGTDVLVLTDRLTVVGATEFQSGTLALTGAQLAFSGPGAGLAIDVGAAMQTSGTVTIASGGVLHVAGTLVNTGTITVAAGGSMVLGGAETTVQLGTLAGDGTLVLSGALDNAGQVLDLSSGPLAALVLGDAASGGTLSGGTLRTGGHAIHPDTQGPATVLDGVAVDGLLDLAGGVTTITGSSTFTHGFGGASGAIREEGGTLSLDLAATLHDTSITMAGGVLSAASATELAADTTVLVSGDTTVTGGILVDGIVAVARGGRLTLDDASLAATATVYLGEGATVTAAHAVAGTVRFTGSSGLLDLAGSGALSATLDGFGAGDTVRLDGMAGGTLSLAGDVLTVTDGATTATLTLGGASPYAASDFTLAADAQGRTVLTTSHAAPGTADPLFDMAYYLARNPAVGASGLDPYAHYLAIGGFAGLDPDPWFDSAFYLRMNPDVAAAGINPLVHYEGSGWSEGRAPSLLFSGAAYLAAYPDVAGTDPLLSFIDSGEAAGRVALPAGGTADPLVQAGYLFGQTGATLLPGADAAAAAAATLYKSGGWMRLLNPDPLFDTTYYMAAHGREVLASGLDPLTHYETIGWREGLDPSLLFSNSAYLAANPDVAAAGFDPLFHYLTSGQSQGRAIHAVAPTTPVDPLLDTATVEATLATLHPAGGADPAALSALYHDGGWRFVAHPNALFDAGYYLATNPDVAAAGIDPLAHYETYGAAEGRNPSAAFDDAYYLAQNPDVAASGMNPLLHYETYGWHEGRDPNPLFDTRGYLAANPDVAAAGVDPLVHYETAGWHEGRNPNTLLDVRYYLAQNPDVAAAGIDPMVHFETYGWHEGRNPDALFDTGYYLARNPDVAAAGIDPLVHYETAGWHEGRNPSAAFDTDAYLGANADVRAAGVDPLAHYLAYGQSEGRAIYAVT